MANRGRGTLEVRPSRNPFFQSASREIGGIHETEYDAPVLERPAREPRLEEKYDFQFLYTQVSAEVGKSVTMSDSKFGKAMAKTMTASEIARLKSGVGRNVEAAKPTAQRVDPSVKAEAILQHYKHNPRPEHIMYQTTNNSYGIEAPTVATLTAERKARSQQFSNSFNGIKYRDQGLCTGITRSQVNNALDFF